jgi:hypothetical protein
MKTSVVDPNLDPRCFGCPGSGSGSRGMETDQNLQINLVSCLSKRPLYLRRYHFFTYHQLLSTGTYIFQVKTQLFVTTIFEQDSDPHKSASVLLPDPDPNPHPH